ncbi:hypothetical protein LTR10_021971 [Elasticomyces elasticus]|uniref:SnoaL-like domain-containing protein n=1 Tax=Exophiala sideris TaxID=1016849 RepID=A0ABR0JBZ2_9EURO|nr:hypothetical protein LTR10_021971 [Elasticomyces elasticus]KAK5030664.1 hypothetical protein LTS07_005448 [Exophiala sideris]KAK5038718.1 hypothetical protein LTR13_004465 [Exophiala sideris]KAK5060599.1 hypothetical protein LTR69_005916 [Exophiala sideris]KAK5183511.1 hypothetical protein LTR44_004512 [Eurotiomycetes sp. CCFEE 6388]
MGYNTALAEWPSIQIPHPVKEQVDKFFSIMDTKAPEAGDRLAEEIFASDGVMDGHHRAEGTEALRRCRDNAWKVIQSRRHELLKVYTDSKTAEDLLVLGQVTAGYHSGEKKRGEFTARIRLVDTQTRHPKITLYKVWMDASAMVKVD